MSKTKKPKTEVIQADAESAAQAVVHIQDIMKLDHQTANKNYAFLIALPAVGQYVGFSFKAFGQGEDIQCFPTINFVQSNGLGYTRVAFEMKEEDFDALHVYAQAGRFMRQALVQDITWAEMREAITVTLAEVITV